MANVLEYFPMNGSAGATETGIVAGTVMSVVNNVGSSASGGPSGETVRDFERDSLQYLTTNAPDNSLWDIGNNNRMFSVWCKPETDGIAMGLVTRYISGAATRQWLGGRLSGNKSTFTGVRSDNAVTTANNSSGTSIVTGSWFLYWCWYDAANQQVGTSVNLDAGATVAFPEAGLNPTASDPFRIGFQTGNNMWDGLIGPITYYSKVLTLAERTYIYNNGLFRPFPYV